MEIEDFSKAIRLNPNNPSHYSSRGTAYYKQKQYDLAIKDFTEAIRLDPTAVAYDNREEAYKKKGRYDLAAKDAAEAVRLSTRVLSDDEIDMLLLAINTGDKDKISAAVGINTTMAAGNTDDKAPSRTAKPIPGALSQVEIDVLLSGGTSGSAGQQVSGALTQAEKDALLSDGSNCNTGQPGTQILSKYEIEQLLSGMNTGGDSEGQILLKTQIEALSALHKVFASSLAARPRLPIHASVSSVVEITHEKFIRKIPESSILATVSMKPLEGNGILGVDPYIAFSIADKLIGGIGERINSQQDFTIIATHVMEKVFAHMLEDIRKAWIGLIDLQPELVRVNSDPQLLQIAHPTDKVIFVTFKVTLGNMKGSMGFCVPYLTIEPIVNKLSAAAVKA